MSLPTPRSVFVYADGNVAVVRGHHEQSDPLLALNGEQPTHVYHVRAAGDVAALRQALIDSVENERRGNAMPQYVLTIGEQADLNLHRLAQRLGISEVDVLRNAINTYSTLKK